MRILPIICVAAVGVTVNVASAQQEQMNAFISPPSSAASLNEFWTSDRLREAKPMPLPVVNPSGTTANDQDPKGGRKGAGPSKDVARSAAQGRSAGNVTTKPLYFAGKLYFNTPKGTYVCSAQFVAPGVLITAGHCVQDDETGQWYTNVIYRHNYDRGREKEKIATVCQAAYKGWVTSIGGKDQHWTFDFAMIKLRGGTQYGNFGWEFGWWGKYQNAVKVGYPGAIANGEVIQVQQGQLIKGWDPKIVGLNHGDPNNAEGSSGGAWVPDYNASNSTGGNHIISVTSHHQGDKREISYGPYWGDNMEKLLQYAQGDCK